jgi:DNA-binding CsgD family transcriptional regulator
VLAGIQAGARGYLLKDVALAELVNAIKTVAEGGSIVKPAVTQRLLKGLEKLHNEFSSLDQPDPLTERETEILRLMAGGYSNKEIANSLGVAEGTVKNHVSNILSKMGVRDRTRASSRPLNLARYKEPCFPSFACGENRLRSAAWSGRRSDRARCAIPANRGGNQPVLSRRSNWRFSSSLLSVTIRSRVSTRARRSASSASRRRFNASRASRLGADCRARR